MDKKKICTYAAAASAIILISVLMPRIISTGADLIARRISPTAVEETTEAGRVEAAALEDGSGKADHSGKDEKLQSGPESGAEDAKERNDAALQEEKIQTDDALTSYRRKMDPQITEARAGLLNVFIDDREDDFLDALSDYLFSNYGNIYSVTKVSLISFIAENDNEITCQVQVFADNGHKEYTEYYYCSYNTKYDFYSVYAYHE